MGVRLRKLLLSALSSGLGGPLLGLRGTEAGAMRSTAFCPFSGMLAQCGDQEWRGGKVDANGKSLKSGCGLGGSSFTVAKPL